MLQLVTNIFTVEGKGLDFTKLSVLNLAGQFEVNSTAVTTYDVNAAGTAATAWVAKTDLTVDDLNANLSGQGFKFAFPNAVSDPDVNPFADQMIAVDASTVDAALTNKCNFYSCNIWYCILLKLTLPVRNCWQLALQKHRLKLPHLSY